MLHSKILPNYDNYHFQPNQNLFERHQDDENLKQQHIYHNRKFHIYLILIYHIFPIKSIGIRKIPENPVIFAKPLDFRADL